MSEGLTRVQNAGLSTGLIAYYSFDGNNNDEINGFNGLGANVIPLNTGKINQSVGFNALSFDPHIRIPLHVNGSPPLQSPFRQTAAITYSCWVRLTDSNKRMLLGVNTTNSDGIYTGNGYLDIRKSQLLFNYTSLDSQPTQEITATIPTLNNGWNHIVFTLNYNVEDDSANKFYVNGQYVTTQRIGTFSNTQPDTSNNATTHDTIGCLYFGTTARYITGEIDELAIWDTFLSTEEVLTLYNAYNVIIQSYKPKVFLVQ